MIKEKFQPHDESKAFNVYDAIWGHIFPTRVYEEFLTYSEGESNSISAELTEKGKQYALSERQRTNNMYIEAIIVKTDRVEFGEITGIVQEKESNTAMVNFTLVRKDITPFGRIVFRIKEGAIEKSVTFIKYDDGWRIY